MNLKINANRMNLLRYRRRLKFALRGHKLLKDKQEQLTREFNSLIISLNNLRKEIDKELEEIYSELKTVYSIYPLSLVEKWFELFSRNQFYNVASKKIYKMNLKLEMLETQEIEIKNFVGLTTTDPLFNLITKKFIILFPKILQLANMEYLCELIAKDLQTTRRRVNALEYILIPQIKLAIRFILDKLNELERTNITQLMRVKQLMEKF